MLDIDFSVTEMQCLSFRLSICAMVPKCVDKINSNGYELARFLAFRDKSPSDAGWSSLVARRAHNPKVTGSNPVPATTMKIKELQAFACDFF